MGMLWSTGDRCLQVKHSLLDYLYVLSGSDLPQLMKKETTRTSRISCMGEKKCACKITSY